MKLTALLAQRQALLRQAHLANLAFAYDRLGDFVVRIARAGLRGPVLLKRADPEHGRDWPVLIPLYGHQSVIDEHFTDEDIIDLADVVGYALDAIEPEIVFDLSELETLFRRPVRLALEEAGIGVDERSLPPSPGEGHHGNLHSSTCDDDEL
ncbi:MAG: hypothetical protein IAE82_02740 [Opitutaceae bacterium]|nr:hypothetical protein [Opitutaceae bacterium]